jgi:2-polyprenyl-3-methyl-5-hydroxy-6-metoxy-1,4-benzoquinol methylase
METIKKTLKDFYEQVGEKYPEEEIVYNTLRGMLRKKFVKAFLKKFKGSLLDIGSNTGMYLDGYEGGECFGVDLSLNVLRKNNKKNQKHLIVADAEKLQCFKAGAFDNVLCSEVLEHCLNPQQVFDSISHVLKPNGLALLTTPNYRRFRPKWIGLGSLPQYGISIDCDDGYFHTAYRPEELSEFTKETGLKIVELGTLEKDVKYAAKIPAAIFIFASFLNRLFKSQKFYQINKNIFIRLTDIIYDICRITGLDKILLKFVKEGVRSYIIMKKSLNHKNE